MNTELELTLVQKITESYAASVSLADEARRIANNAVAKAIECGHYLIEAKTTIGRGGFLRWFETHFGTNVNHGLHFSRVTAAKYMRLAETPIEHLKNAYSLRQAYIAAGILPKPASITDPINRDPDGTNWIPVFDKYNIMLAELLDARPLSHWHEEEKAILCERIRPVAMIYVEAGGKL